MPSDLWGQVNVPSPHGLRYCLLVINHHTHYMWARFPNSKDDACSELEIILPDIKHLHARAHPNWANSLPSENLTRTLTLKLQSPVRCARTSASGSSSLPHTPITCSAKPNVLGALSETMRRRCSTVWPFLTPCGHALSTLLCTSATVRTVARSAPMVASPSPSLRRMCLAHQGSAPSGAPSSPMCPTDCVENSVKKRFAASWLATPLTHPGTVCTARKHAASPLPSMLSFGKTPRASAHISPSTRPSPTLQASGYLFTLGRGPISYKSKQHTCVA
jgi:hypothetical protein